MKTTKLAALLMLGLFSMMLIANAETYVLTVKVEDSNYAPLVANVVVKDFASGNVVRNTNGDSEYFFSLSGEYTVEASAAGYQTNSAFVVVDGDDDVVELILLGSGVPADDGNDGTDGTGDDDVINPPVSDEVYVKELDFDDEAAPNEAVEFDLELKNNATYDAEDITATIIIENLDDGEDVEEDIEFSNIDAGDRETETVSITIPTDAEDDKYTIKVELEWEDDDGNSFSASWTSPDELTVERPKHQVLIENVELSESSYKPGETVQIGTSLINSGSNDETVQLKVSSVYGQDASASFGLDEGDTTKQYLSFVIPEAAKAGKYFVTVSAAYGSSSATKQVILTVAQPVQETVQESTVAVVEDANEPSDSTGVPAWFVLGVITIILAGSALWLGKDYIIRAFKPTTAVKARSR